ncbi:TPA: hypothetical protein DIV49_00065 [Candidatus Saccharibacteria bacterium]|nr:hypothetical protein [Candidatus Saccharibacteria bacterium]HRJ90898.1 hypothetical protein [Candidatus Saccharibacteria bacterium]
MSSVKHHIIYIPGLGDSYDTFRVRALKTWKWYGVSAEHVAMNWASESDLQPKLQAVESAIARAVADGKTVSLVGESGGAAIALLVAQTNPQLHGVVTVCGVANSDIHIGPSFEARAKALPKAVAQLRTGSIKSPVHNYFAAFDEVISPKHSQTPKANHHRLWTAGHFITIFLCLTVLAPHIIRTATK